MRLLFILSLLLLSSNSLAQNNPPYWAKGKTPDGKVYCDFIVLHGQGNSLNDARKSCLEQLYNRLETSHRLTLNVRLELNSIQQISANMPETDNEFVSESFSSIITDSSTLDNIKYKVVDEHVKASNNCYSAAILYAVDNPDDDSLYRIIISEDYKMLLSPIPGAAQFAKGSYLKGGLIIAGIATSGIGVGLSQYQIKKASTLMMNSNDEMHKLQYAKIANNMTVTRNVCIGMMAGVYLYNIIDAFCTPGQKRFRVLPYSNGKEIAISSSFSF